MQEIKKVKQLVVVTDDKPGMLAEISGVLAKEKVNLDAICAYAMKDKAVFYVLCSDAEKAETILMKKGWQVKEEEVVVVSLENKPGVLSKFADKLKAKNINLAYCYGSACDCSCGSRLVFKAEDNNLAIAALK